MASPEVRKYFAKIGRKGGKAKSEAKANAARRNALQRKNPAPIRERYKVTNPNPAKPCDTCGKKGQLAVYAETWGKFCSDKCRKAKAEEIKCQHEE